MTRYADDLGPPSHKEYAAAIFATCVVSFLIIYGCLAFGEFGFVLFVLSPVLGAAVGTIVLNWRKLYVPARAITAQAWSAVALLVAGLILLREGAICLVMAFPIASSYHDALGLANLGISSGK